MANSRDFSVINGNLNIIGKKILEYRKELNLSRQKLSDKLMFLGFDISPTSIYDIEK